MVLERSFDEASRARVAGAVRAAEAGSRGQVVPVVVARSDDYAEVRLRSALLAASLVTVGLLLSPLHLTLTELPVAQVAGGLLGWALGRLGPVERWLVGRVAMDQAVRSRAMRAFLEHGLHQTAEGTGVLLFASLLEREAVVLGDHGIHARMGEAGWDEAVQALLAGLRRGDPGQGFEEAVARCGARLAEHFPRDPAAGRPANELADEIRVSRG